MFVIMRLAIFRLMSHAQHSFEASILSLRRQISLNKRQSQSVVADFIPPQADQPLTEIREGDLYFCLEQRLVTVRGQVIPLTVKEFEIFALLILNPKRVFTYEMLLDLVWHEDYSYYSRKAINNHISNLRKKLRVAPDLPDYVKSVYGVGYKFEV